MMALFKFLRTLATCIGFEPQKGLFQLDVAQLWAVAALLVDSTKRCTTARCGGKVSVFLDARLSAWDMLQLLGAGRCGTSKTNMSFCAGSRQ